MLAKDKGLPEKWQSSAKALKAVQVAFDLDEQFQFVIRLEALKAGISPSDMIRKILELPVNSKPKRPRLTVSLNGEDYEELARKFDMSADQQLQIKKQVMQTLMDYVSNKE